MRWLIIGGGVFWLAAFVFHALFWRIFDWNRDLGSLKPVNRAVMQVLNLSLMVCFLIFAYVSLFQTDELLSGGLGTTLLVGMVLFGILRAIQQLIFFDMKPILSKLFLSLVCLGTACYIIPLLMLGR